MNPHFGKLRKSFFNIWVLICAEGTAVLCVVLLVWGLFHNASTGLSAEAILLLTVAVAATAIFLCWAVIELSMQNSRLKQSASDLHDINHVYRDTLSSFFSIHRPSSEVADDRMQRLLKEREVLNHACQKIANIFTNLIGRQCTVTVKLLTKDEKGVSCFTWARSDHQILRDDAPTRRFEVSSKNTGFLEALKLKSDAPSHFHSEDLLWLAENGKYENERPGWKRLYRSAIVVPIRNVMSVDPLKADEIGFLCVDTMAQYRLNDDFHVQFMAAFADQMYNFLSIMRRTFISK